MSQWEVIKLSQLPSNIKFELDIKQNNSIKETLNKEPVEYKQYQEQFDKIQQHILCGNTYVTNLTTTTNISTNYSLSDIYEKSSSKFKLFFKDKFVCFSPERFISCKHNTISTFPMKGTIDATIKNAKQTILENKKELAEHTMIVDLLRNDLSIVATNVKVNEFRYCETIKAGDKKLIQVSSDISGNLSDNWHTKIGDIITSLLPAGSITGTPKRKTIEIINEVETHKREYFSGIFGIYDGKQLDSAVMIRFIEELGNGDMVYKSGGGITCDSDCFSEYNEMLDKVYIP